MRVDLTTELTRFVSSIGHLRWLACLGEPDPTALLVLDIATGVGEPLKRNIRCFMKESPMSSQENAVEKTPRPRPLNMEIEHIKQIYDYTKFHIGLYFTFLAGLIAFVNFGQGEHFGKQHRRALLGIIFTLLIGGVAGALVASRIVYGPWQKESFYIEKSRFWKKRPSQKPYSKFYWSWADVSLVIEHYAFWLALSIAIVTFARS